MYLVRTFSKGDLPYEKRLVFRPKMRGFFGFMGFRLGEIYEDFSKIDQTK